MIVAIGAGRMGRGIAHVFAYAGYAVKLIDIKSRSNSEFDHLKNAAIGEINNALQALAKGGLFESSVIPIILDRIEILPKDQIKQGLVDADFIFECVPEVLGTKQATFEFIQPFIKPDAILASTTSTILVDTLAAMVARPEQFINAHWLNPAYLIPLVEISPGEKTSEETTNKLKALLEEIGKVPVICAASPGFIVPRIQALAMNEAARMAEEGVASVEDIDKAIRYGFGFRFAVLGLLEFIDWGGGDILYYASRYLQDTLDEDRFQAPDIIEQNMQNDRLGLRSGQGFYDFSSMDVEQYRQDKLQQFVALLQHIGAAKAPVVD